MKKAKGKGIKLTEKDFVQTELAGAEEAIMFLRADVAALHNSIETRDEQIKYWQQQQESTAKRWQEDSKYHEASKNDLSVRIHDLQAQLERQSKATKQAEGERDRILRLVDQFTSVQIVTHGFNVQVATSPNGPAPLRNDSLKRA